MERVEKFQLTSSPSSIAPTKTCQDLAWLLLNWQKKAEVQNIFQFRTFLCQGVFHKMFLHFLRRSKLWHSNSSVLLSGIFFVMPCIETYQKVSAFHFNTISVIHITTLLLSSYLVLNCTNFKLPLQCKIWSVRESFAAGNRFTLVTMKWQIIKLLLFNNFNKSLGIMRTLLYFGFTDQSMSPMFF